jgi:hypothetical protein
MALSALAGCSRPESPSAARLHGDARFAYQTCVYARCVAFTADEARAYIARVRWQFAKTMPQWPHEYTVREWSPDLEREFVELVVLIRRDGVLKAWPP